MSRASTAEAHRCPSGDDNQERASVEAELMRQVLRCYVFTEHHAGDDGSRIHVCQALDAPLLEGDTLHLPVWLEGPSKGVCRYVECHPVDFYLQLSFLWINDQAWSPLHQHGPLSQKLLFGGGGVQLQQPDVPHLKRAKSCYVLPNSHLVQRPYEVFSLRGSLLPLGRLWGPEGGSQVFEQDLGCPRLHTRRRTPARHVGIRALCKERPAFLGLKDTRLREAGAEVVYCLTRGAPKGPNLPRVRLNHQDALFPGHGKATHSQTWAGEPAWLGVRGDATLQTPVFTDPPRTSEGPHPNATRDRNDAPATVSNNLNVVIDGHDASALVDTGADYSVLSGRLSRRLRKVTTPWDGPQIRTAGGHLITPVGRCTARVEIHGETCPVKFVVLQDCSRDVILGMDFLCEYGAVIDLGANQLTLRKPVLPPVETNTTSTAIRVSPTM
ncbi:hypothetical protein ISCGN_005506 [Ixodes scapularis]